MGLEQSEEERLASAEVTKALVALHGLIQVPALKVLKETEVATAARRAVEEWFVARAMDPEIDVEDAPEETTLELSSPVRCRELLENFRAKPLVVAKTVESKARTTMQRFRDHFWNGQAIGPPGTCREKFGGLTSQGFFTAAGFEAPKRRTSHVSQAMTMVRLRGLFVVATLLKVRVLRARYALTVPGRVARQLDLYAARKVAAPKKTPTRPPQQKRGPRTAASRALRGSLSRVRVKKKRKKHNLEEEQHGAALVIQMHLRRCVARGKCKHQVVMTLWRRVRRTVLKDLTHRVESRERMDRAARTMQASWLRWLFTPAQEKEPTIFTWVTVRGLLRENIARRRTSLAKWDAALKQREHLEAIARSRCKPLVKRKPPVDLDAARSLLPAVGSPVLDVLRYYQTAPTAFFEPTIPNVFQRMCEPSQFLTDATAVQAMTLRRLRHHAQRRRQQDDVDIDDRVSETSFVSDCVSSVGPTTRRRPTLDDVLDDTLPLIEEHVLPAPEEVFNDGKKKSDGHGKKHSWHWQQGDFVMEDNSLGFGMGGGDSFLFPEEEQHRPKPPSPSKKTLRSPRRRQPVGKKKKKKKSRSPPPRKHQ